MCNCCRTCRPAQRPPNTFRVAYSAPKGMPRNHGKFWSRTEDNFLYSHREDGASLRWLANQLSRSIQSVRDRCNLIGAY